MWKINLYRWELQYFKDETLLLFVTDFIAKSRIPHAHFSEHLCGSQMSEVKRRLYHGKSQLRRWSSPRSRASCSVNLGSVLDNCGAESPYVPTRFTLRLGFCVMDSWVVPKLLLNYFLSLENCWANWRWQFGSDDKHLPQLSVPTRQQQTCIKTSFGMNNQGHHKASTEMAFTSTLLKIQ